ncbi:hypothetical protein JYU14_04125 [Simkania negevensis]|uniref:Uncharacterized protein n=1 Tax=Simkania negevensis TaxID=83561 RepID=A0ABS3AR90_9BACT|nr:hypothetical protein [Simkania negevensis]
MAKRATIIGFLCSIFAITISTMIAILFMKEAYSVWLLELVGLALSSAAGAFIVGWGASVIVMYRRNKKQYDTALPDNRPKVQLYFACAGIVSVVVAVVVFSMDDYYLQEARTTANDSKRLVQTYQYATKAPIHKEKIMLCLAGNPVTPPELLHKLGTADSIKVRSYIAKNPRTPPATLKALARDTRVQVRSRLATNPSLPSSVFEILLQDPEDEVVLNLSDNPALPEVMLARLALMKKAEEDLG